MHPEMEMVRCSIMRGGTSKGIFIMKNDLPTDPEEKEKVVLSIFGSPDIRQIDGLGGADLLTSKLAIISPSTREDADLDYTFAQVGLNAATVDIKGNCGNIAAAVGPFAINSGLVEAKEPVTTVRIHLTNSKNLLIAEVPVKDGKAAVEGDFSIDGVPGTGARITLDWSDAQGAFTGKLLPTGNVKDIINVDGKEYPVSILDLGNSLVFIKSEDIGIDGTETPQQIESNKELMDLIEQIRGRVAAKINMVESWELAATKSAYAPFFAIVSPAKGYTTFDWKEVKAEDIDIVSRLIFMQKVHKNYPVTSTVSTGVAAKIPGTVVSEVIKEEVKFRVRMNIGHPAGSIPAESIVEVEDGNIKIIKGAMYRTARPIMDGYVYVRKSIYNK
jgi:2-methylaconitate cis-trans-isomerase PrpF